MWWWSDSWGPGWLMGFPFPLIPLLFMAACFAFLFFMMRGTMGGDRRSRESDALDILKERFARGEITKAQYEEQRRVLLA